MKKKFSLALSPLITAVTIGAPGIANRRLQTPERFHVHHQPFPEMIPEEKDGATLGFSNPR
jgi:hypothetical protein